MFEIDSPDAFKPKHAVKCPHCTAHLQSDQDHDPHPDDQMSCYFHGVIGTRDEVHEAAENGDLQRIETDAPGTEHSAVATIRELTEHGLGAEEITNLIFNEMRSPSSPHPDQVYHDLTHTIAKDAARLPGMASEALVITAHDETRYQIMLSNVQDVMEHHSREIEATAGAPDFTSRQK